MNLLSRYISSDNNKAYECDPLKSKAAFKLDKWGIISRNKSKIAWCKEYAWENATNGIFYEFEQFFFENLLKN